VYFLQLCAFNRKFREIRKKRKVSLVSLSKSTKIPLLRVTDCQNGYELFNVKEILSIVEILNSKDLLEIYLRLLEVVQKDKKITFKEKQAREFRSYVSAQTVARSTLKRRIKHFDNPNWKHLPLY